MPETKKKQCPFDRQLMCENCRLFYAIAGQHPECMIQATARQLFMIQMKGDAGGIPIYLQHG